MKRHFEKNVMRIFFTICLVSVTFTNSFARADIAKPVSTKALSTNAQNPKPDSKPVVLMADQSKVPVELEGVGVKEHLGSTLDLENLTFIDSIDGKNHKLKEYFNDGKPVLLNLVYFECPMLCTLVLNGVSSGLKGLQWSVGKEFNVVTVSINSSDTAELGKYKRETYLKNYLEHIDGQPDHDGLAASNVEIGKGWHFLTGTDAEIRKLADQVGFQFKYDEQQKEFAHPAVTFILTKTGEISRYLYGITYKPQDLKLSLLEASQGKVGNVFDRLLMFCYHYEPSTKGYTLQAVRVMQAGGAATVALLAGFLIIFWTRQRKGKLK